MTRLRNMHPATRALVAAWLVAFAIYVAVSGVPTRRSNVLVWVTLGILAIGAARPRATLRSLVVDWLPVFSALVAYDLLRGVSDTLSSHAHIDPQVAIDKLIGGGEIMSAHLQGWLFTPGHPHLWDYAVWGVYVSHFIAPLFVAVVLWGTSSPRFRPYVLGVVALSWAALLTYALYPAQPPWMVAQAGEAGGHVTRVVHAMWNEVGVERAARVFSTSPAHANRYSNPVAALPSLHAAFPMLIFLYLRGIRRWLDWVLGAYVLAMGFSLIYAGEHFVFDVLMGWAYALVVWAWLRRVLPAPVANEPVMGYDIDDQSIGNPAMPNIDPDPQAVGVGAIDRDSPRRR